MKDHVGVTSLSQRLQVTGVEKDPLVERKPVIGLLDKDHVKHWRICLWQKATHMLDQLIGVFPAADPLCDMSSQRAQAPQWSVSGMVNENS
jgi:hypothetical protein